MVAVAIALLWQSASFASCSSNSDNAASQYEQGTSKFVPRRGGNCRRKKPQIDKALVGQAFVHF